MLCRMWANLLFDVKKHSHWTVSILFSWCWIVPFIWQKPKKTTNVYFYGFSAPKFEFNCIRLFVFVVFIFFGFIYLFIFFFFGLVRISQAPHWIDIRSTHFACIGFAMVMEDSLASSLYACAPPKLTLVIENNTPDLWDNHEREGRGIRQRPPHAWNPWNWSRVQHLAGLPGEGGSQSATPVKREKFSPEECFCFMFSLCLLLCSFHFGADFVPSWREAALKNFKISQIFHPVQN